MLGKLFQSAFAEGQVIQFLDLEIIEGVLHYWSTSKFCEQQIPASIFCCPLFSFFSPALLLFFCFDGVVDEIFDGVFDGDFNGDVD